MFVCFGYFHLTVVVPLHLETDDAAAFLGFYWLRPSLYVLCGSVVVLRQQKPAAPPRLLIRCVAVETAG